MELPCITISQLHDSGLQFAHCHNDELLVTDKIEAIERFRLPCRIYAVTMLVCIQGEMECIVNLNRYHVERDTIVVAFPDDIIQIKSSANLDAYAVLMSPTLLNQLDLDCHSRSDFYIRVRECATFSLPQEQILSLKPYYTLLSSEICNTDKETEETVKGLLYALAYSIFGKMRNNNRNTNIAKPTEQDRNKKLFGKFMTLARHYHTQHRGVKFYADKLCLTPNYLSGAIKEYTGKTVTEWVNEFVMLEAKIMLKDSSLSIQEISRRLNFPDQSTFGKYFKKAAGIGPKQYRKGR